MPKKGLIIFDLDWTLLYLRVNWPRMREKISRVLKQFDKKIKGKYVMIGTFGALKELNRRDKKIASKEIIKIMEYEERLGAEKAVARENSPSLLIQLRKSYNLAIFSNNGMKAIKIALKTVGIPRKYFIAIMCRDNSELKPSPLSIIKIVKKAKMPQNIYVVGDEPLDVISAKRSKKFLKNVEIKIVGIPGWKGAKDLKKSRPDFLIKRLRDLQNILV